MPAYLLKEPLYDADFVNAYDELPLWSASFVSLLLAHAPCRDVATILDLGSGTGVPALELAERCGTGTHVFALDPWEEASRRARTKAAYHGIGNIEFIKYVEGAIPLPDASVDLVVSNLGINNFSDFDAVCVELVRVLKPGGRCAVTTNTKGHFKQFYRVLAQTLRALGMGDCQGALQAHVDHRGTVATIRRRFAAHGLAPRKVVRGRLLLRFRDGTAFLNHHFIVNGFLGAWKTLVPSERVEDFFGSLEQRLNARSKKNGELRMTVPMLYLEFVKPVVRSRS